MANGPDKSDFEYNSQLDAFELYHLITEDSKRPSSIDGGPALPALGHALAGSVATATSKLLIYPLDLVIARLQVQKQLRKPSKTSTGKHAEYQGLLDAVSKIYQHEGGISAFYTGCLVDVSKGIADSFLFFLAYTFLQQYELKKAGAKKQLSVAKEMGIGIAAGAFAKLVTTPLQNIITRQQTAALLTSGDTEADGALKKGDALTVAQIAKQIYKERGLKGFWAGYSLSLILTLNPAITFAVDNFLQKLTPASSAGAHITFLIAAFSKAIATSITYPVSVAKSRAQAAPHTTTSVIEGTDKEKANGPTRSASLSKLFSAQYAVYLSLQKIYQQEGLSGLYSGLEGEVLKGFLSHGLTMMVKDRVHHSIIKLYYFLLKATKQWPAELREAQALAASVVVDARQKVGNVAETTVEAGESALDHAKTSTQQAIADAPATLMDRGRNIAETVAEGGKSLLNSAQSAASEVRTRLDNVSTTILEGSKHALGDAQAAAGDMGSRVENVATTVAEGGKHAAEQAQDAATSLAGDAIDRTNNVSTTLVEGGKHALNEARSVAGSAVSDAVGRTDNFSTTVAEGGKHALDQARNAAGSTADDVASRAENVGTTLYEGGKQAISSVKASTESVGGSAAERVDNVATTVGEAAKNVVKK